MRDWLNQRSTWLGFGAALLAGIGVLVMYGKIDPMWSAVVAAVLSAIGLKIKDGGGGPGALSSVIGVLVMSTAIAGCGSVQDRDVSDQYKTCIAVCGALDAAKCWDDPGAEEVLGAVLSAGGCIDRCMDGDSIITKVDVQCLIESDRCNIVDCVHVE